MPSPPLAAPRFDQEIRDLARQSQSSRHGTNEISVWLGGLDGGRRAGLDDTRPHYAASTMKLPLAMALYRQHERGVLDLDSEIEVHNRFGSALDGSTYAQLQADDQDDETWAELGSCMSLRELARHMIVKSGNLATNLLLERVGVPAVAEVLAAAGCSPLTTVARGIANGRARDAGLQNTVTAADLSLVLAGIGGRSLAAPATCESVEEVLSAQEDREKIPAGLPPGTYVAHKTGWVDDVVHDVGIVRPDDAPPYVLSVLTTTGLTEAAAADLIAQISAAAWQARLL